MSLKTQLSLIVSVITLGLFTGCVPSDNEIASDMAQARREAYLEWKAMRDSGKTKEAKVDGPLSIDDAVRMALQYNKQLQVTITQRQVTRGERIATYSVILPGISATGSSARVENGRGNNDIDRYSVGLRIDQPIFEGQAIPARLRTARLLTALTDEQIREQVQNLIANVASEYYDVLLAQHMVEVQREALVSAEAQFRMTSEKRKQETATDADVLRARSDVAKYQSQMIMEQNNIDTHRVTLLKYMGVSQDSTITFSDKLEFLPMRPVFERAVEIASGRRPDLRIADLEARRYDEAVRIARSAYWPVVGAYATVGWGDGWGTTIAGGGRRGDHWGRDPVEAGINVSMSFGIDNYGNLEAAKAEAKQRQIEILDYQENMLQEIRLQMNILNNAEQQVNALVESQASSREALRLVEVGYQAGVKTEVDVTDARKTLTEVMGQYYTAINQHAKARVNLQLAMGVLGPTTISDGPPTPPGVPIANIEEFAATDYVPPAPIVMPTPDRKAPESRPARERMGRDSNSSLESKPDAPAGRTTGFRPEAVDTSDFGTPIPYTSSLPMPSAPVAAPARTVAPPAPVAVPVAPPAAVSAASLPIPPASAMESTVQTASAPVQAAAQPLFKVTVREGGSGMPEIARID